ncbi:MAG: exodeoxyribonuclease VII small subunit [Mycobacteriales bacterium]
MPKKTDNLTTAPAEATAETAHSYEQARDELAEVVSKLETGGATLEESLTLWERGEKLAAICQEWLDGARQRLAAIAVKPDQGSTVNAE